MLRNAILASYVYLAGAGVSFGQDFQKPGPEHAELKKMVGTWDAVMDMGGQKAKCTAVYKSICNGMWVANDFEGNLGGIPYQGHGLDGYDPIKKQFVGVWVDSMSGAPMHMAGNEDPKTKLLVMTGESTGPDGKPQKFKATTETKDDDHFTFKMYMVQAGGKEDLAFTIEYSRRK